MFQLMRTSLHSMYFTTSFSLCRGKCFNCAAHEVCNKLLDIKPSKAHGPDNVLCRIVKEIEYELAEPITTIFNTSLQSGIVPVVWKESNIIPIPKNTITYG